MTKDDSARAMLDEQPRRPRPNPACMLTTSGQHCPKCCPNCPDDPAEPDAGEFVATTFVCSTCTASSPPGAWMLYDYDHGPYVIELQPTCEQAVHAATRRGYGRIGFWPFGIELRAAVEAWVDQATRSPS